jgi:glycosyltransferase involved in cell wall biosynthesis
MQKARSVLLLLKLPPPYTGATLMNYYVTQNKYLQENFNISLLELHYNKAYNEIGSNVFLKSVIIIKYCLSLIKELIRHCPKFVYFQISPLGLAFYRDLIFIIIIKIFQVKILYHLHGKGIKERILARPWLSKLYKFAFYNNFIICLSEIVSNDIEIVYNNKPYIVNNGIPVYVSDIDSKRDKEIPTLLFISNIRKQKGIFDFITICESLKKRKFLFNGIIIGQERDMTSYELEQHLKAKDLQDYVKYIGPKFDAEKYKIILEADILIHPTYNEAWGLVLLEAMESGLPIVTTNEGSIPYIVKDKITGFICNKGDLNDLTDKTILLIKDKALRKRIGIAGRERFLDNFTIDHFNSNMLKVFNDVYNKS